MLRHLQGVLHLFSIGNICFYFPVTKCCHTDRGKMLQRNVSRIFFFSFLSDDFLNRMVAFFVLMANRLSFI